MTNPYKEITIDDVLSFTLDADREDRDRILGALKDARTTQDSKAKYDFNVGDKVKFHSKRDGWVEGIIKRINRTRIVITPIDGHQGWSVPASWLEKVE